MNWDKDYSEVWVSLATTATRIRLKASSPNCRIVRHDIWRNLGRRSSSTGRLESPTLIHKRIRIIFEFQGISMKRPRAESKWALPAEHWL